MSFFIFPLQKSGRIRHTSTELDNPTQPCLQTNIAAVLFMWVTLPAFGAAAYIPSLVLGTRALHPYGAYALCSVPSPVMH
eukprot:1141190-Pelagomonas_calceolata.AAC.4